MPWRNENCGATAFQGSNSTSAPATLASDSFGSNGCFCRVRRWRASGSARLSAFSVPAQGATGEEVAGAAGRSATRASAVCVRLVRPGSAGAAWSVACEASPKRLPVWAISRLHGRFLPGRAAKWRSTALAAAALRLALNASRLARIQSIDCERHRLRSSKRGRT
jgi:hypothetical protein